MRETSKDMDWLQTGVWVVLCICCFVAGYVKGRWPL